MSFLLIAGGRSGFWQILRAVSFALGLSVSGVAQTSFIGGSGITSNYRPLQLQTNAWINGTNASEFVLIQQYLTLRSFLMNADKVLRFDADIQLDETEKDVDQNILKVWTAHELTNEMRTGLLPLPRELMPALSVYDQRRATYVTRPPYTMEDSPLFKFLYRMPKGALLHLHYEACGRARFIIEKARLLPNCYVFAPGTNQFDQVTPGAPIEGQLAFGSAPPGRFYKPASEVFATQEGQNWMLRLLTLEPANAVARDPWKKFGDCFTRIWQFVHNEEVFHDYLVDTFETLASNRVDYVELRCSVPLYDGLTNGVQSISAFEAVLADVKKKFPDFDAKLILSANRGIFRIGLPNKQAPSDVVQEAYANLTNWIALRKQFPDRIVGFDIVGREDTGVTENDFLGMWAQLYKKEIDENSTIPLFLHAGESAWASNENVYDAVLFGSQRLGHGFNLYRFRQLFQIVHDHKIPLEICPISNKLLGICTDPRMHPAYIYMALGIQIVLSSDDPSFFGYAGLTPDFWVATTAWNLDLAALKKLAKNSILYSAMNAGEKARALRRWEDDWHNFILEVKNNPSRLVLSENPN